MKTRCRRCRTLIPFRETYCDSCQKLINAHKKEGLKNKKAEALLKTGTWKSLRKDIITRDKGCCVLCFKQGIIEYRKLQVHHIIKRTEDESLAYEPSNLVTLCRSCHEKVELLSVQKQKELLGELPTLEDFRL